MHRCRDGSRCSVFFHSQINCIRELSFCRRPGLYHCFRVLCSRQWFLFDAWAGLPISRKDSCIVASGLWASSSRRKMLCARVLRVAWTDSEWEAPTFIFFSTSEGTLPCLLCWHKVWNPLDQPLLRETLELRESGVSYRAGIPWFCVWWRLVGREFANPHHQSVSLGSLRLCRWLLQM